MITVTAAFIVGACTGFSLCVLLLRRINRATRQKLPRCPLCGADGQSEYGCPVCREVGP